jgi:hypothetical protein
MTTPAALLPDTSDLSTLRAKGTDPDELFASFAAWAEARGTVLPRAKRRHARTPRRMNSASVTTKLGMPILATRMPLATPMAVPLTVAQTTASQMSTSGSAGLAGGVLPVAARQLPSSTFFAKTAARIPENSDITDQTLELSSFSCSLTFLSSFDAIRGLLYCSVFQPMTCRWSRPHASG